MDSLFAPIAGLLGLTPELVSRIAGTFLVLVVWLALVRIARRLVGRAVDDPGSRFQVTRVISYTIGIVSFVLIGRLWIQGVTGLATYFGLLSAGIAIALQDPLTNLAGWIFVLVRRPFRIGDRIQIGAFTGDVVDIRPFRFVMLEVGNWVHADQSTGRILHVPNGLVFKNAVANYDEAFGCIWNELELTVSFESNWKKAKAALEEIAFAHAGTIDEATRARIDSAADEMNVQLSKLTPVVWTSLAENGVRLTMRYLCKTRERRASSAALWEKILEAIAAMPDVDFAYPTMRRFDRAAEGKTTERRPDLRNGGAHEAPRQPSI